MLKGKTQPPLELASDAKLTNLASRLRIEGFYALANEISDVALYNNVFECNKIVALIKSSL